MGKTAVAVMSPSAEHRRVAVQNHERARQVLEKADYSYGIELLRTCCSLDPANLIYRKTLRAAQKKRYERSFWTGLMAQWTTFPARMKLQKARLASQNREVLDLGEQILSRNPFDTATQLAMAAAADRLGLIDVAVWVLEQARQKDGDDARVNRPLAQLLEKQGNYTRAISLWELVGQVNPQDMEAHQKTKDLAAMHTISKGQYEQVSQGAKSSQVVRKNEAETADPMAAAASRQLVMKKQLISKLATDPTNVQPYLQLARLQQEAGELEEARRLLQQGLAATGQHFDLQTALAELELEPFRQNLHLVEQQLKTNPKSADLSQQQAGLSKEINTREIDIYRQRADRYPTEAGPRLELGIRLYRAQQIDAAIQELQHARKDPRQRWRAQFYLGHCFKARNNWPLAKRNFEEALQSLPANEDKSRKELLYQLAVGAAEERDWQHAVELGNELANLDFGFRQIGRLVDEWSQKKPKADAS